MKGIEIAIGFVSLMALAASVVTAAAEAVFALAQNRGRCLAAALTALLRDAAPVPLTRGECSLAAEAVLRHPLLASPGRRAAAIRRDQLIRLLFAIAASEHPAAAPLRRAFGMPGAAEAAECLFAIQTQFVRSELSDPIESRSVRERRVILTACGTNPFVAELHAWFGPAMSRATRRYRAQAQAASAGLSLALVVSLHFGFTGSLVCWTLLTFGSPFWYDVLKRFFPLRRTGD